MTVVSNRFPHLLFGMYIPSLAGVVPHSLVTDPFSFTKTHFVLDGSAMAGVLGGEEAITFITLVHVFDGLKWFGWYNSPGSYPMGKLFGLLSQSAIPVLRKAVGNEAARKHTQSNGRESSK